MGKTRHNPPGKKEKSGARFIKFSKMQQAYINEILARQQKEFNEAIGTVYEDMGMAEKIQKAPPGTYMLRKDFSGLDVLPVVVIPTVEEKVEPENQEPEKPASEEEKEAESTEEPAKEKAH